jgi:hypothetical protein
MKVMEKGQCPSKVTGVSLCITSGILDSSRISLSSQTNKKLGLPKRQNDIPFTMIVVWELSFVFL